MLRQVLDNALQLCIANENKTCEEMDDGYFSLNISQWPSPKKLDVVFALSFLSATFMLKTHLSPDPLSPALIQAVVGGFDSLLDIPWINTFSLDTAQIITSFPTEHTFIPYDC